MSQMFVLTLVSGLALLYSTIALLVVLLRRPPARDVPVEGINGLDDAFNSAGRDLPTRELPRPSAGTVYTSSHGRKSAGRGMASLERTHVDWTRTKAGDLSRLLSHDPTE